MDLAREVYRANGEVSESEMFGLRMQMRRSAVSVASNIAEGHGRLTDRSIAELSRMARGSLYELQTQIELASDLGFLAADSSKVLLRFGDGDGQAD